MLCLQGLILWVVAESIWAYNELALGQETPFPSIADAFGSSIRTYWLPYVQSTKFFGRGIKKPVVIAVTTAAIIFSYFYLQAVVDISTLEGI